MLADDSRLLDAEDPLLTSRGVIEDLRSVGLPISLSWFEKLCQAGEGPIADCRWGRRPMWKRSSARAWAAKRMTTSHGEAA